MKTMTMFGDPAGGRRGKSQYGSDSSRVRPILPGKPGYPCCSLVMTMSSLYAGARQAHTRTSACGFPGALVQVSPAFGFIATRSRMDRAPVHPTDGDCHRNGTSSSAKVGSGVWSGRRPRSQSGRPEPPRRGRPDDRRIGDRRRSGSLHRTTEAGGRAPFAPAPSNGREVIGS